MNRLLSLLLCVVISPTTLAFHIVLPQRTNLFYQAHNDEERRLSPLFAKKGKKKGNAKKNKQKPSGFEWASNFSLQPFEAQKTREVATVALASFKGRTGKPLSETIEGVADVPKALWNAPIACVVMAPPETKDTEEDSGNEETTTPATNNVQYANVAALETVGVTPKEYEKFILPADYQGDDIVYIDLPIEMKGDKKYESGYEKKILRRPDEENKDITILNAHRWVLEKTAIVDGKFTTTTMGVAYAWEDWLVGESTICSPGGIQRQQVNVEEIEAGIQKLAYIIRQLKEDEGFGNQDPEVVEAVRVLLEMKDKLAAAKTKSS